MRRFLQKLRTASYQIGQRCTSGIDAVDAFLWAGAEELREFQLQQVLVLYKIDVV